MNSFPPVIRCDSAHNSLVFDLRRGFAELIWIGNALPSGEDLVALCDARILGRRPCQPNEPEPCSIFPRSGWGSDNAPAVALTENGRAVQSRFLLTRVDHRRAQVEFTHSDAASGAVAIIRWSMLPSGILQSEVSIRNTGSKPFELVSLASLALPLPAWAQSATLYSGRWSLEMQKQRQHIGPVGITVASNVGRPGFGGGNWVRVESHNADETSGSAIAAHLAWSGDHLLQIERNADGQAMLLMSARLEPGEIVLEPGGEWRGPGCIFATSSEGFAVARQAFHRHAVTETGGGQSTPGPRKVHLNTWEALGFDMDLPKLCHLADAAAATGIERFVLDDGWFTGRRDDSSSLGDWTPDPSLFPNGLDELIDHVEQHGMDFGLWVEPEMISPDSDLYRAHPDWCIHVEGEPRPTQRNQLVLDLARPEVTEHVFGCVDWLLRNHRIAYLKWDHNRALFPLAGKGYAQVTALYALLDRIRAAHPHVEIESCASGGGRVDFGILERCARYWASDNNDALDRLTINAGWFDFLPLAATGNHVGPSPNPITGRSTAMDFRAKVAMFGHMGVEADPAAMSKEERDTLAAHIAVYKQWRDVLHSGTLTAAQCDDPNVYGWFVWALNRGIALIAQTQHSVSFEAPPVRLAGLAMDAFYKVRLLEPWPRMAASRLAGPERWREGLTLSGRALCDSGLSLPLTLPQTAWLIAVELLP